MSSPCSSQESSLYANLQMRDRQIRLLEITSTKPEIVCKLEVVSLDDEPAYSALSYVWGDPGITKRVLVNGRRVHVTTNLALALEHAPKHLEDASVAPRLWADAICINQDDPNEKNHQLPFMKNIYSQAEVVICWLGPPDDQVYRGFDWIDIITRECSFEDDDDKLQDTFDDPSFQKDSEMKDLVRTQSLIPKSHNLAWVSKYPSSYEEIEEGEAGAHDITRPFEGPYWSRVWIFQEVALAKKPIFVCGARCISLASLDRFTRWTHWLKNDPTIVKPQVMSLAQWEVLKLYSGWIYGVLKPRFEARLTAGHPISSCLEARDAHIQPERHWYMAYNLVTSNPKDYFYGFLGLSCLELVPDYSANTSVGMVCRDFMVEYVRAYRRGSFGTNFGELELLTFAGVGHEWHEYPETPSWAPNLPGLKRNEVGTFVVCSGLRNLDDLFLSSCKKVEFVGSDMLSTVLILDMVQDLGPMRRDFGDRRVRYKPQGILSWVVNFAISRQEYVTGCHPLVALHSTLHFDSTIPERERFFLIPGFGKARGFVQWVASSYKEEAYDGKAEVDEQKPSSRTEYLNQLLGGQPIDEDEVVEETTGLIRDCFEKNQRLAETSFGYVGIFPLHVQPGDVVCMLNGLQGPVVLREAGEGYKIVGTCFVQGLQSAEQVHQLAEKGVKQVETIVIR